MDNSSDTDVFTGKQLQFLRALGQEELEKLLQYLSEYGLRHTHKYLENACSSGNKALVELLLLGGANPNPDPGGFTGVVRHTALGTAATGAAIDKKENSEQIVKLLLDHGANPNVSNEDGENALSVAVQWNNKRLVELLLGYGAAIHAKGGDGATAFDAAQHKFKGPEASQYREVIDLIDKQAKVEKKESEACLSEFKTFLRKDRLSADGFPKFKSDAEKKEFLDRFLLKIVDPDFKSSVPDVNPKDTSDAFRGFNKIVVSEGTQILKMLLDYGVDPNVKNEDGVSALVLTVLENDQQLGKLLLDYGADPNASEKHLGSALFAAVKSNNIRFVKILLDYGADPTIQNENGHTVFDIASANLGTQSGVLRLLNSHDSVSNRPR